MPRYMLQFAYTPEAWAALAKNPADRRPGIKAALEKLGGRFVDLYYHFGKYDGFAIVELPDDTAAAAASIGLSAPGHLRATKTTRLLTVEETVQAMKKAGTVAYQAPSPK